MESASRPPQLPRPIPPPSHVSSQSFMIILPFEGNVQPGVSNTLQRVLEGLLAILVLQYSWYSLESTGLPHHKQH
ncbi:hypothetical protein E2C01_066913 [Portunus trituberculatus]|uniref:Uncharacterized protein n=1 Tax=Portunus trituberculatus TaxID=210409 RepID=A0A5B7HIE8_PORTR|nr:hypothetical protein [Portunus trituberculatus]